MTAIAYPDLMETFQRALDEVLLTYFANGGQFFLFGQNHIIHRCEIHYAKNSLLEAASRPKIAILGTRTSNRGDSPGKCHDGTRRVRVEEAVFDRMAHVFVPRGSVYEKYPYTGDKIEGDKQLIDQVWQNLLLVLHAGRADLRARGIWQVQLDEFPQENSDEQYWINTGKLRCFVRYSLPFES